MGNSGKSRFTCNLWTRRDEGENKWSGYEGKPFVNRNKCFHHQPNVSCREQLHFQLFTSKSKREKLSASSKLAFTPQSSFFLFASSCLLLYLLPIAGDRCLKGPGDKGDEEKKKRQTLHWVGDDKRTPIHLANGRLTSWGESVAERRSSCSFCSNSFPPPPSRLGHWTRRAIWTVSRRQRVNAGLVKPKLVERLRIYFVLLPLSVLCVTGIRAVTVEVFVKRATVPLHWSNGHTVDKSVKWSEWKRHTHNSIRSPLCSRTTRVSMPLIHPFLPSYGESSTVTFTPRRRRRRRRRRERERKEHSYRQDILEGRFRSLSPSNGQRYHGLSREHLQLIPLAKNFGERGSASLTCFSKWWLIAKCPSLVQTNRHWRPEVFQLSWRLLERQD